MTDNSNIYAESQNSDFNMIKGSNQPKYTGEVQYESFSDLIPKKKGLFFGRQGSGGRSRRHKEKTTRRHKRKMRSTLRRKKGLGKKSRKH